MYLVRNFPFRLRDVWDARTNKNLRRSELPTRIGAPHFLNSIEMKVLFAVFSWPSSDSHPRTLRTVLRTFDVVFLNSTVPRSSESHYGTSYGEITHSLFFKKRSIPSLLRRIFRRDLSDGFAAVRRKAQRASDCLWRVRRNALYRCLADRALQGLLLGRSSRDPTPPKRPRENPARPIPRFNSPPLAWAGGMGSVSRRSTASEPGTVDCCST